MNEKVTKFYEAISADDALQEELVAVTEGIDLEGVSEEEARAAIAEAIAAFAAEHDLDLTAADILAADAEAAAEGELTEAELAAVAGGAKCACFIIGALKGCGCVLGGASGKDSSQDGGGFFCFAPGA